MAKFPKAESKIQSPVHEIISGLEAHPGTFPDPPVSAEDLKKLLDTYVGSFDAAKDKQAEASHAIDTKNADLETTVDAAKRPPCATFSLAY
uniref:Uncharacterized protein n=1 Tax=Candidatus Kentrum sp. SD TaxID=2126332 RepID=A0A450YHJ6_9GAMM|nr:MAG: hypothetical protein BECKSD772E_GA0070983_100911 [Candidatus Kentron sp. SD]